MKILVSDKISAEGVEILKRAGQVDVKTGLTEDQLVEIIGDYDALAIRSATKVTARIIEAAKKMKIIGRAGVGVDNIDVPAATKKGIVVVNSPEGNTIAAAEQTIALMMALARHTTLAAASMRESRWEKSKYTGIEVYNKILGVIGLGKIGRRVAEAGLGLGMKVVASDPFVSKEAAAKAGITLTSLDEVIASADFLTLHVPKNDETANLINKERIAKMKKGVRIINCARGGIVNEADLIEAVQAGQVAGAALDVFAKEPPADFASPLFKLPQIITTPHLGAATEEAQLNVAVDIAEQIVEVLQGGQARAAVNIPSMRPDLLAPVKPYLKLAEKLGKLAVQMVEGAVTGIEISYLGEVAGFEVGPLTVTFLKGFLEPIVGEAVNFVNAPILAKERGLKVVESKETDIVDFVNLISVRIKTEKEERTFAGTVFGTLGERLVFLDRFRINVVPTGFLLFAPNVDRPGMIGKVGTILGKHNINIAAMEVGRQSTGGQAVMVLNVDNTVPQPVLDEIAKLEGISGPPKLVKL